MSLPAIETTRSSTSAMSPEVHCLFSHTTAEIAFVEGWLPTITTSARLEVRGRKYSIRTVGNQHKWDTLGPERSGVGKSLGELPESPVMKPWPVDSLSLHPDGGVFADY